MRERIKAIKNISLVEFCLDAYPEKFKQEGSGLARHKDHSSLVVTHTHYFYNAFSESGDSLDYLMRFENMELEEALEFLEAYGEITAVRVPQDKSYSRDRNIAQSVQRGDIKRGYAYLIKTRRLHPDTVRRLANGKYFTVDKNANLCFFGWNGASWCELVGTLSDIRFKGLAKGSIAEGYFYFSPLGEPRGKKREANMPDVVAVCESAIDALSLWEMSSGKIGVASMAGLKSRAFEKICDDFSSAVVAVAVDRDKAGDAFAQRFPQSPRFVPKNKDWNEDLLEMKGDLNE